MRKIITVPILDRYLKSLAHRVSQQQGRAIFHVDSKKLAVLVAYTEYQELEKLRSQNLKTQLLQKLTSVRQRAPK